ncbi:MAG: hypothetical protein ACR2P3_07100 [Geminicoccaceae bacterium]
MARRARTPKPVPTAVVGIEGSETLYQAILDAGEFMLNAHDWSILRTEATIATVASTESYVLESDFYRFIHDTAWDQSNLRQMLGSTSPQLWQWGNNSTVTLSQLRKWFQLKATQGQGADGTIEIFPTPTAVETLSYEYVSQNWAQNSSSVAQSSMTADDDTSRLPEHPLGLMATAFMLESQGLPFLNRRNDAERMLEQAIANDAMPPMASANRDPVLRHGLWNFREQWPCNVPDGGFGS